VKKSFHFRVPLEKKKLSQFLKFFVEKVESFKISNENFFIESSITGVTNRFEYISDIFLTVHTLSKPSKNFSTKKYTTDEYFFLQREMTNKQTKKKYLKYAFPDTLPFFPPLPLFFSVPKHIVKSASPRALL